MKKPLLKLYQAQSGLHNNEAVLRAHQDLFSALNRDFEVETVPVGELKGQTGTVFLFVATGGVEEGVREAIESADLSMIYLVADGLQNSLAASMEIAAWLGSKGIGAKIIHGTPDEMSAELLSLGEGTAMRGCRVGLMGGPSGWLISSDIDYKAVSEKYGIEFVPVSLDEIVDEYHRSEPAEVEGIESLRRVEPTEEDLRKALVLTSAIETVVKRHRLDAFTLKCFDLLEPLGTTGCLALAVLNAKGIPAGCEGDVPSLLTMLLARRVADADAFMANPSRIDSVNNRIIFAHCTLPLKMADTNILRSHFESGIGVALQGVLPLGDITVVKWWGPEMNHHFISRGRLLANHDNPSMCRTQVTLELDESVNYFLKHPLGNHHVILLGDHTAALSRFFGC
ncbi:MAG: fucose isomerase [Muribaculaceae bacterium]|nr:fucose isomerase [Muribaculaceae bacterium]